MSVVFKINGKRVSKDEWDKRPGAGFSPGKAPMGTVAYSEADPWTSQSVGCMPGQVAEYREFVRKHNLSGVRVNDDGSVECTTRGDRGRRGLIKALGDCHDNDGGYGDG